MIFKPTPWPVIHRMFTYPPSFYPLVIAIIWLALYPRNILLLSQLTSWQIITGVISLTYLALFFIALIRYAFGSYIKLEEKQLVVSSIDSFGIGRRKEKIIDLSKVTKVIKKKEVQRIFRRGHYTFYFLTFELDNKWHEQIEMRTWDEKNFIKVWEYLKERFPSIEFENSKSEYKSGKISF